MRTQVAILVMVCGVTFLLGVGRPSLTDSDEAFYAESAREMLERQDWLTPYFNYEVRFQKPVLYYWAVASTYSLAGVSAGAARFPSALSGVALVLLTYACGRRWMNDAVGWLAGLMVATSFGYFAMARSALPDLPLTFFVCAAVAWGAIGLEPRTDSTGKSFRRRWLVLAAIAGGLAVLTKGPVGLLLPVLVLGAWRLLLVKRGGRWSDLWPLTAVDTALVFLVLGAVAVPWYAAMYVQHGADYLYRFFVGENLERFATARYNEPRSFFFYVPIVMAGLFPWSLFIFGWLKDAWAARSRQEAWTALLWAWWVVPLAFYSLSVGKQPRYILPILPALALLIAKSVHTRISARPESSRVWVGLPVTAIGVVLTLLGLALHRIALLLLQATDIGGFAGLTTLGAGLLIALGCTLAIVTWTVPLRVMPALVVIAAALSELTLAFTVMAGSAQEPVQRMAALVDTARRADEPVATHRVFVRNLVFYTGSRTLDLFDPGQTRDYLRRSDRVLCLLPERVARDIEAEGVSLQRLGEVRYFNTAAVRLGTLLAPNPDRDLQTVVLVANR